MAAGVLLVAALLSAHARADHQATSLQMAGVVFRHGHRNIMRQYDFDPYSNNVSYWPGGIGQITSRGKMQMYKFGQLLRERYSGLLSDAYTPEETLVRSSSSPRCVSSALCVLAGLFPPTDQEVWNPDLLWQPVPLYAPEEGHDKLIRMDADCPAYREEFNRQMSSPEMRAFNSNYSDVYRVISEHWKPVSDFEEPNNLHDHFRIEEERGIPLPDWTRGLYPDKLLQISNQYHIFRTYTPLMARLKMGPLVKDVVGRMIASTGGASGARLLLYSGHDDMVTGLLGVLGLPNRFKVRYGAAVFLELHSDPTGNHHVQVFFMADTDEQQIQRIHPVGCDTHCDLDMFANLTATVTPVDWDQECQLRGAEAP
ncbi:lysosomal acid phosphatase-like [Bacillus rossius redtenbacheri]|uniref:lysosomal acid phosphatase-like n=1 Tax=Bacillus rossius redtenbacheri TaxID=93214 RepID=UPI002FDD6D13